MTTNQPPLSADDLEAIFNDPRNQTRYFIHEQWEGCSTDPRIHQTIYSLKDVARAYAAQQNAELVAENQRLKALIEEIDEHIKNGEIEYIKDLLND